MEATLDMKSGRVKSGRVEEWNSGSFSHYWLPHLVTRTLLFYILTSLFFSSSFSSLFVFLSSYLGIIPTRH